MPGAASSLDLTGYDTYTLLTYGGECMPAQQTFGFPVKVLNIDASPLAASREKLRERLDLNPGQWILIRPDGHVAARG